MLSSSAVAIDAGAQLRRFQDETQRRMQESRPQPKPIPDLPPSPSKAAASASSARTYVGGFEVHGVTQFSGAEIAAVLKDHAGRTLDTAEIHAAANALMRHYRNAGFMLAKVFVPPQTFHEVVRLEVEEGYLEPDGIEVINKGERVRTEVVRDILDNHLYSDRPLQRRDLERALLIAEDLPGTRIGSVIYPGTEVGSARLRSVMTDEPLLSGNIDIDNFNNRQLGQERLGTTLYLNSPSGAGDQAVVRLVTSGARSNYAYLTYLRPVGSSGARVGASIDYFNYDANALYGLGEIGGHASDTRLYATYPLVRSRYTNVNLRTDFSHYRIVDRNWNNPSFVPPSSNPFADAERRINLLQVSLSGDESHDALPNGTTLFDLTVAAGNLDITGNSGYQAFDASGPHTDGGFGRFNLRLQRLQHLSGPWSAYFSLVGQLASGNLDSSQRFYLGGATSLAGYPVGEASGDQGAEIHLELRRDFAAPWGGNLQAGLFYGQGWLRQLKDPWFPLDNNITLQTAGLQLTQTIASKWVLRGLIGWQFGPDSPVEKVTGNNSDGRDQSYRAWFQVIRYFGFGGV
ncbi:MAG: ShlB/FhaC/HecB family hemolysin secretion/activation protein [Betaproteobacteria bacterium]|nr:ShlB/FhaC/HecB family hemolysin secretion/activation protein [Betaproteobacteria bacterium]